MFTFKLVCSKDIDLKSTKDNLKFMNITHFGICQVSIAPIRAAESDESEIVTQLLFGDYVEVMKIGKPWVKIYFPKDDYEGHMDFKQLKYISKEEYLTDSNLNHQVVNNGVLSITGPLGLQQIIAGSNLPNYKNGQFQFAEETFKINEPLEVLTDSFIQTSLRYLNTPYLWGGKGILGIDCSGLIQIVCKIHGISLPRDASKQVNSGEEIDFTDRQPGDIMFFINSKRKVHHVGVLTTKDSIIHAAGHVRIDRIDDEGIFREDFQEYTHKYHSIRRL